MFLGSIFGDLLCWFSKKELVLRLPRITTSSGGPFYVGQYQMSNFALTSTEIKRPKQVVRLTFPNIIPILSQKIQKLLHQNPAYHIVTETLFR